MLQTARTQTSAHAHQTTKQNHLSLKTETCPTGNCDTGTNQNKGHFIIKCSNNQCNFKTQPQPINLDLWKISEEYRNKVDLCPLCGANTYLKPRGNKQ